MPMRASATRRKGSASNLCGRITIQPQLRSQRPWTPLEPPIFWTVRLGGPLTAMAAKSKRKDGLDFKNAAKLLEEHWQAVTAEAATKPDHQYVEDTAIREVVHDSINHGFVAYRFCLPIQLLGKMVNPALDCLRLQKRKNDPSDTTGWDARSLGRHVVALFNQQQENILGDSKDPYVGNPMRIPKMLRDDQSKRDIPHWNRLVDTLTKVEQLGNPAFTTTL